MPPSTVSFAEFLSVLLKSVAKAHAGPVALAEDPRVFHRVFYRIERKYKKHFPELRELHFITAGAYPYSPELTETLDVLQMSGVIERKNPSFEKFSPTEYTDTGTVLPRRKKALLGKSPTRQKAFDEIVRYLDSELSLSP
jgi:hypothetical protein